MTFIYKRTLHYCYIDIKCSVRCDKNLDVAKSKVTKLRFEGPVSRNKCDIDGGNTAIIEPKDESEYVHRGIIRSLCRTPRIT